MLETWAKEDWIDFIKAICVVKTIDPSDLASDDVKNVTSNLEMISC
jgi:hypothetical protein